MLPFGQLQEGLLFTLTPISSVQEFNELCLSAKKEERRPAELQKKVAVF